MITTLSTTALIEVQQARYDAVMKHGPLKPGADRWMRLLGEEFQESQDELVLMAGSFWDGFDADTRASIRANAIAELAQLAQLAIGVIELLQAEEADSAIQR